MENTQKTSYQVNVFIYSDSTAMPRPGLTNLEDTWPFLLALKLKKDKQITINLITRYIPASTAKELLSLYKKDAFYFSFMEDSRILNLVVFAFGIVDVAPRPFTHPLRIISKFPKLGPLVWRHVKKPLNYSKALIMRLGSYKATSLRKYRNLISKIFSGFSGVDYFILLETPIPHVYLEGRNRGFQDSVYKLNILKKQLSADNERVRLVTLDKFLPEFYISKEDGHHFANSGHAFVANQVSTQIQTLVSKIRGNLE